MTDFNFKEFAIVGAAFRFPGDLTNLEVFWRALLGESDLVSQIDPSRWATELLTHPKRSEPGRSVTFSAGVLSRIEEFDAEFFGISPREAAWLDPQQRLLLELSWEAIEDAGIPASRLAGSDCAVYVGISGLDYGTRALDDLASLSAHTMTGNTLSIAANRLSYVFDLHGPSMAIDTACSSSLVALHQACNSLRTGEASMAMVGGVNLLTHPYPFIGFSKASMLSAGGRCRAFDAAGDGYVRAEGGAVLLLKPLGKALKDGDRIHAVILSSGVNADGARKTGLTIPSSEAQEELMRAVLARAGIDPADVDYLEAHGTGTAIGDPIETSAIGRVYGQARAPGNPLPIGSVKTNLGHLEPASGLAGLIKAMLVLKHRCVPPNLHLQTPNPKIDFSGTNLLPVTQALEIGKTGKALVAGVNSFGFGGANAHVLIRAFEPQPPLAVSPAQPNPPLILSARSEPALRELAARYAELLDGVAGPDYYDFAYTATYRRERLDVGLAVRAADIPEMIAGLRRYAAGEPQQSLAVEDGLSSGGKIAFIYSGNGAQWQGMGQLLLAESEDFRKILVDLDARMVGWAGFSVIEALNAGEGLCRIDDTAVAQPLLFAIQVALTILLRQHGIEPEATAGHSVGEVAAAWAAGALSLDEAIRVICTRSAAQATTRGMGRMAAVAMSESDMLAMLEEGEWPGLEIAGVNSPSNLTLSGPLEQLQSLGLLLRKQSVVFRLLDLDYAFHSRAMDSIEAMLLETLGDLSPESSPQALFVSTVSGGSLDRKLDATYWWDNVRQPVRFQQAIEHLVASGCRTFVEVSPHAILQRYLKECLAVLGVRGRILDSLRRNDDGQERIDELALRLYLLSRRDSLHSCFPVAGRFVDLPRYPWQRERHWLPSTSEGYHLIERRRCHPLLGWRLRDAQLGWENVLDPRVDTWLADHCVGGAVVLPGAAYVEMALAAAGEWHAGTTQELEQLDILSPVVFDGEHGRSIRFDLNPRDGSFQIRSRQRLTEDEWALNASGRLLGAASGYGELPTPGTLQAGIAVGKAEHYRLANRLGLDYGPAFQGLASARLAGDSLWGELNFADSPCADESLWHLYPASLDVCFQSLLDFFRDEIEAGLGLPLLPVKIGRLRLLLPVRATRFHVKIRRRGLRSVTADFTLLNAAGQVVAALSACRFRAAALRQEKPIEPACWEIVPVIQPGTRASAAIDLPSVGNLKAGMAECFAEHENDWRRSEYFNELQPLFDAMVAAFAHEAMHSLMASRADDVDAWLSQPLALDEARRQLLFWVVELLQQQGWLVPSNGTWRLIDSGMPPAAEIWRTLLAEHPSCLPELLLAGRKGRELSSLLSGQVDAVSMANELRASLQYEALYERAPAYVGTRLAIEHLLVALDKSLPPSRRLRILEIDAGVTMLPRQIGERLAVNRVDYVVAHADAQTCDKLRHEYEDLPWVTVVEFDYSAPDLRSIVPVPVSFDVVILRHVLNDVADPSGMLAWSKARLASGGLVVIAERGPDLATELLWGRQRLFSPVFWEERLQALAFDEIETCREPAGRESSAGGYLVFGKRSEQPESVRGSAARWLLLADDEDAGEFAAAVREAMMAHGHVVVCQSSSGRLASREYAEDFLHQLLLDGDAIQHVVMFAAKRQADDCELAVEGLNLVNALAALPAQPTLTFVTDGAVLSDVVEGLPAEFNPAHTALWGLGRVVMNEYPALNCRLIDVPRRSDAAMLATELLFPDAENEIVLRDCGRKVLRMRPREIASSAPDEFAEGLRFRLDFRVPGQLRNLQWFESQPKELGPQEIEVQPKATGLNFRDIMYVMGLLPDEAVENGFAGASLGLEFSGVVTRIGGQVSGFAPGDAVMGFGSSCFASHVVTTPGALTLKPEKWSFEAAATVPTVFFTVYYALRQLANLQAGERILIHGGAGGVGIAAIQLARHLGAEVFATAGSAEKRLFVDLLGAEHVFDSRNLSYADQIMAATAGEGVDVVLNSLAGEAIRRNLQVLRPFGRFLELGKRDFFENTPIGLRPFKDNISYFGIDADQLLIARPELAARLFQEVMALFESGALSPLPAQVFPAERVVDAFRYMQQARQIGKVVVGFERAHIVPRPLAKPGEVIRFSRDAAYLVTGGLSGFGLETARWLARRGAGQLILLSRRGRATPGAEEALNSLQALGAEVIVQACDVTDRAALRAALKVSGSKPLKGIFHAAMVIDDALMANLSPERMRRVLFPKIKGAWNLHEISLEEEIEHFMLYSSVTTYIGNPGQANYVAANAWLEGLASFRRGRGLPVSCIGWGPIGDSGYLTRHQNVRDGLSNRLGADPLRTDAALAMLDKVLAMPQANLAIADFQFVTLSKLLPSAKGPRFIALRRENSETPGNAESLDDFRALIEGKTRGEAQIVVARLVTQEVAQILAIAPERIDPARSLHDLGLDSLMGVELALGLEKRFGIQVPAMMLNEGPTVDRVTERILERLFTVGEVSESTHGLNESAAELAALHGVSLSSEVIAATAAEVGKGRALS